MTLEQLTKWANEKIDENPHLKSEIYDLYSLCRDEIDEGGSESHEIELCMSDIEQLIKEE
jgi:hypothetical protein